jgi:hypothetical protein
MSASGEDIREDIRLVACSVLKDDQTNVDRNIVIFEYNLPYTIRSAFYQSSGGSITTHQIFKDTYFPFYGSTVSPLNEMQNTLIKATQHTQSGSIAPILQQWQHALREMFPFIKVYDEIFKRFTHFHELRISALIGSSWWSSGGTSGIIRDFVLSHVWDGEKFIEVGVVSKIDVNLCFNNETHILEDDNLKINTFLRENGVDVSRTRRTVRSRRTVSSRKSHRSRSRDRGSSSESDSSRERTVSDDQQPKSTMERTYAVGPRHIRPTSKGGTNTRKKGRNNKNKTKRRKRLLTRRRRRHRHHSH